MREVGGPIGIGFRSDLRESRDASISTGSGAEVPGSNQGFRVPQKGPETRQVLRNKIL